MNLLKKQKSYIAYFDLVGFKSAILADIDEACNALEAMRLSLSDIYSIVLRPLSSNRPVFPAHYVRYKFLSDSFILYTTCDTQEDLLSIVFVSTRLLMKYFFWRLPMRGGLAFGDFYLNEQYDLFCGKPLVRAYEIGEYSQWLGLVFDDEVAERYMENPLVTPDEANSIMLRWDVYYKGGVKQNVWVANWPPKMEYKVNPPITGTELYEVFEPLFRKGFTSQAEDTRLKYNNTAKFINYTFEKFGKR